MKAILYPTEHMTMSGKISGYHNWEVTTGIQWVEKPSWYFAKHRRMYRAASHNKELSSSNSTVVEKPCSKDIINKTNNFFYICYLPVSLQENSLKDYLALILYPMDIQNW